MNACRSMVLLLLMAALAGQRTARAGEKDEFEIDLKRAMPIVPAVDESRECRAGCPERIAPWARFTYGEKYCGYFIGGGAALYGKRPTLLHGERRYPHEGTWGIDYKPWYSRVRLQWFHGKRRQDGDGHYEPDELDNPLVPLFFR